MNAVRKFIGLFVLLFIALPVLFGIIWAVGLTQALVSPQVISELPQNIVRSVPQIITDAANAADLGYSDFRPSTRAWLRGIKQAGMTPREVFEKAGFKGWVENELAGTLNRVSDYLKGRRAPEFITLDFRPLKAAFSHPVLESYFNSVLEKLPACDADQSSKWQEVLQWGGRVHWDRLPACRPDPETARKIFEITREKINLEMPDEVHLFENADHFPRYINFAEIGVSFSYLLFLIPAGFILIGALIAARDRSQFFRWCGFFILLGGLLALGSVYLTHKFSDWIPGGFPPHFWERVTFAEDMLYNRFGSHVYEWLKPIFNPVKDVAEVVSIIGLLVFALSFVLAPVRRREVDAPAQEPPAAPPASS